MKPADDCSDTYHHGDLRRALMCAACERIAEVGTEALSLRSLCRDLGVSPTAPYRHFPTKNCLFAAIAQQGFERLNGEIRAAIAGRDQDPMAQLIDLGVAYVQFACTNPVEYHLMFGSVLLDFSDYSALTAQAEQCFTEVVGVLERGVAAGVLRDAPIELLAGTAWAAVHGMASLLIDKSKHTAARDRPGAMQAIFALGEHTPEAMRLAMGGLLRP
jgi:AcrR family transcriptional regulator